MKRPQNAKKALPSLQEIWQRSRSRYFELGGANRPKPPGPQNFVFVGLDREGLISLAQSNFIEDATPSHILRANKVRVITGKNSNDIFLDRSGITENVPSDNEINGWIYTIGAPEALKRAIEMQIKATPNLVGGEISIVQLRRDGSIHCINRGMCH